MTELTPTIIAIILRQIAHGEWEIDRWVDGNFFSGFSRPSFFAHRIAHPQIEGGWMIRVFIDVDTVDYVETILAPDGDVYVYAEESTNPLHLLSNVDSALLDWRLAVSSGPISDYEKKLTDRLRGSVLSWAVHDALRHLGFKRKAGISYIVPKWPEDTVHITMEIPIEAEQLDDLRNICTEQT